MENRFINPISDAELERRWLAAREVMERHDLDALVMQNSNDWLGGFVRWFTGQPANNAYPRAVVFPREGRMVVVEQGGEGECTVPSTKDVFNRGVSKILHTPSYVSADYTSSYDADLVYEALSELKAQRIGWINPAAAYYGFGRALENRGKGLTFVNVTEDIDLLKAIKSEEERDLIRKTTALQDKVVSAVREFIRPGLRDFEIAAYAQYESRRLGAEQGIFISSSSSSGKAAVFRPPHAQGRKIENGDVFALLVETNGPGGYYTEIGRTFVLGSASATLKASMRDAVDAQANTLRMLEPGASCAKIFEMHNAYMSDKGFPQEKRLYCHGQGYDMVERPLIRQDETMDIEKDMSIVVHPGYINDEVFALVCDNYLIDEYGASACLHETPQEILEV